MRAILVLAAIWTLSVLIGNFADANDVGVWGWLHKHFVGNGHVELLKETSWVVTLLMLVNWAFIPGLDIWRLIRDGTVAGSKTPEGVATAKVLEPIVRASVILGWFIFIGLLGYGLCMLAYHN